MRAIAVQAGTDPARRSVREMTIAVEYDGADLAAIAASTGLSPAQVARMHSETAYTVGFLGFSPGFAYLAGLPPILHLPRLATPRTTVAAGAVAIAGSMTAVYPQATPGGWHLIGHTDAVMFDPGRPRPSLLEPGDIVRFAPTTGLAFPETVAVAPFRPPAAGQPYVLVLDPGPLTTVQDRGRPGWAHLGVPAAGAADRAAAQRANWLAGNPPGAAVLESTLGGPVLRLGSDRMVAVTGAGADVFVDGIPARQDAALHLHQGAELAIGPYRSGVRCYVAVAGGLDVQQVLGSRSTDTMSGLGPPPLRTGDRLPLGMPTSPSRPSGIPPAAVGGPGRDGLTVTVRLGPRDDRIGPAGMATLISGVFGTTPSSDRTALRMTGPAIAVADRSELPSEGMVAGAIQVPPDGQPIVFLRNHPTTGGYPVAAVVTDKGVDLLAQARPGTPVRFALDEFR